MATKYNSVTFTNIIDQCANVEKIDLSSSRTEGIVKSTNEFFQLLVNANDIYNKVNTISFNDRLIFTENLPTEIFTRLNNEQFSTNTDSNLLRDIRVVTYLAFEKPGTPGAHRPQETGIQNIKFRAGEYYDDPDYSGYSIFRYKKDIEAEIEFRVWGIHYQDIRNRAKLLRDVIEYNGWYFIHKGLKSIVWTRSAENEKWESTNLMKFKSEFFHISFTEIKELKEKNLEQIEINYGIDRTINGGQI